MEFSLREFRRQDFVTLWSIDQECFPPGISYSRLELAAYMRRKRSFTLVAELAAREILPSDEGGRAAEAASGIVGFIVAEAGGRGAGHITTIDVLPRGRRSGIGSKLLGAAEDRLRAAQCHSVSLETAVDNTAALAFYKRHQYHVVKTVPRYYSNRVDALVLQKDLLSQAEPS